MAVPPAEWLPSSLVQRIGLGGPDSANAARMVSATIAYLGLVALAPDAASTLAVVAFVALALRHDRDAWAAPTRQIDRLTLTAAVFVAAALVSTLLNPVGLAGIWALGKFALIPLSIWALRVTRRYELGPALWLGATAGAIGAGTVALLQVAFTDVWRPAALTNPILFGDLALTLGLIAVATRPLADRIASRQRTIASIAAVSLAVVASVLTQSRGSWIAGPALLVVLALQYRHSLSPRSAGAFGLVVALAITFAAVSHNGAPVRYFENGVGDTMAYIVGPRDLDVRSTSIGARFEMWRSAAGGFRSEPIFGIGWGNLRDRFNADVDAGVRVPRIAQYNHAHNQFISTTASGGLVGLATLLALLAVPGWIFLQALLDRDPQISALGAAGLIVVVGFALFGLTEAILEKASPAVFYASTVALMVAQLDRARFGVRPDEPDPDDAELPSPAQRWTPRRRPPTE